MAGFPLVNSSNRLWPMLAVLGSVTALGIGTSFAKQLFPLIGSLGTTALRVGFSALLVCILWRPWRFPLHRVDAYRIVCYGVSLGCMNLLFYLSLRTIPFGLAVAIEFSGPMAVALHGSRRPLDGLWLALAAVALALLLPWSASPEALDPVGVLCALGAAFFWGAYIVFGKRVGHLPAQQSVALGLLVAACTVAPLGLWQAGTALFHPGLLVFGVFIAAISSAIPISLEMLALQRLSKATFGIMTSMEPAVAAVLALFLLHEQLSTLQWLAIGLSMGAAAGSALTHKA